MKKIFVGNLSWNATEEMLKPLFEAYGPVVSVKIIVDQYTGKSKGFGFVEMETAEGAAAAIEGLNETPLLDRNMRVSLAQPRPERGDRPPRGEGGYSGAGRGGRDRDARGNGEGRPFRPRSDRSYS